MLFATNLTWNSLASQKVKYMLYFGNVLLPYVLIYNLEVSFNFHVTFLQLTVIKMLSVQWELFFSLLPAKIIELPITRTPDNSNLFRLPLKVRVTGSRLTCNISSQELSNDSLVFDYFDKNRFVFCFVLFFFRQSYRTWRKRMMVSCFIL